MAELRLDSGSELLPLVFPNQTCHTSLKCIIILTQKKYIIPLCHSSQELVTRGLTHLDILHAQAPISSACLSSVVRIRSVHRRAVLASCCQHSVHGLQQNKAPAPSHVLIPLVNSPVHGSGWLFVFICI